MNTIQALVWNHRKPICYAKRKTKAGNTCKSITNEQIGGGWSRSSDETSVMEVEQRAPIMQFLFMNNLIN